MTYPRIHNYNDWSETVNKISHIMLALNARIPVRPKDEEVHQAFRNLSLEVSKVASEGGWGLVTGSDRLSELSSDGVGSLMLEFLDQGFSVSLTRNAGILISWHHYIDPNCDAFAVSREAQKAAVESTLDFIRSKVRNRIGQFPGCDYLTLEGEDGEGVTTVMLDHLQELGFGVTYELPKSTLTLRWVKDAS